LEFTRARSTGFEDESRLLEAAIVGVFQTSLDGGFIAANQAMADILGYENSEDLIQSASDIGQQLYVKPAERPKNGDTCWVSVHSRLVLDATGRPCRYEGIFVDISDSREGQAGALSDHPAGRRLSDGHERSRKEPADSARLLTSREDQFRTLLESAPDGVVVSDSEGRIALVNGEIEKMFGYPREELVGESVDLLVPEAARADHAGRRLDYMSRPTVRRMGTGLNLTGRRKDGFTFPVEIKLSPSSVGDEAIVVAIVRDVAEIRAAITSRMELAAIVDASNDAITRTTPAGTIDGWNKGAERIYGYSKQEILGSPISRIIPSERMFELDKIRERIDLGEGTSFPETERVGKGGRRLELSISVFPITDDGGELIGIASIQRDISAQKRLEEQFNQAQRMEAIGRLAGGVAHDFNNILTVITGYGSLVREQLPPESGMESQVSALIKAAERGGALTRQLLAFGRKLRFAARALNANDVISELHHVLKRALGEDIVLSSDLLSTRHILVDPSQLEQVIVNLSVNAGDAMTEGGAPGMETRDVDLDSGSEFLPEGGEPG